MDHENRFASGLHAVIIDAGAVRADESVAKLVHTLHSAGVPTAVVLKELPADESLEGSDGPPVLRSNNSDRAVFVQAARRLRTAPVEAVVVTRDAAGVRTAAAAGIGLIVGVDTTGDRSQLISSGADVVVTDVAQANLTGLLSGTDPERAASPSDGAGDRWCGGADPAVSGWLLSYDGFDPDHEGTRETLCTLGNGYWATRGSAPSSTLGETHYPGTYFAGVYNRVISDIGDRLVESEHMVNAPDWTYVRIQVADGQPMCPGSTEMISHDQRLDLRRGVLTRTTRYRDSHGRVTRITSRQLHSLATPHLAALEIAIQAENWAGRIHVRSAVNGDVSNSNAADDAPLNHHHLTIVDVTRPDAERVVVEAVTNQSGISLVTAARTRLRQGQDPAVDGKAFTEAALAGHDFVLDVEPDAEVILEKVVAVATSRDRGISTAPLAATDRIRQAPHFEQLLAEHVNAWQQWWTRFGIGMLTGARQRLALNLHIFHTLQTVAATSPELDAGVPARGLHGEGYRGHIFWDELFIYPMLTLRRPALTRSLLLYRYRRLAKAQTAARTVGLAGAMFPWQSGSDGREETPTELFNLRNQQWMPDNSHQQRHVGLALAYSVWQYYQATADIDFLVHHGAVIVVEVARFFADLATHDATDDRFDITGVMGPDEFHDGYPNAPGEGLRNNTYTNVLASWVLTRARDIIDLLHQRDCGPSLSRLAVNAEELNRWDRISRRLRIPFHDGVISQFEGYEDLAEFDWDRYRQRYGNIGRLDLILQAEGDSTNCYRLSKQADVLMLFYLFSAEELRAVFTRLGYQLPPELIPRTVHYYLSRTSHGSTLSRLVHSWVLARSDRAHSWSLFTEALDSDLADIQGGTTRTGIHLGAMAGTADMVIRCYAGVETRDDVLRLHPLLPRQLGAVTFQICYRSQPIDVELSSNRVVLDLHPCATGPIRVCLEDVTRTLIPGQRWEMALSEANTTG